MPLSSVLRTSDTSPIKSNPKLMLKITASEREAPNESDPPAASPEGEEAAAVEDAVVITVKDEDCGAGREKSRAEVAEEGEEVDDDDAKVCRICHLSPGRSLEEEDEGLELIQMGCGCKNELGTAHRHCAETWFRLKGSGCCEICGLNANNIKIEESGSFTQEWHDNRLLNSSSRNISNMIGHRNSSQRSACLRGHPFCNFLMACLVLAFILPWFYRVIMF